MAQKGSASQSSGCKKDHQPNHEAKKPKLEEPSRNLQESVCHNEVKKVFCCSDHKVICHICLSDEHEEHKTGPESAQRAERQKELERSGAEIQQRIRDREEEVKLLKQRVETINHSAEQTLEDSGKVFDELTQLLQDRRRDVEQQVRSQQQREVRGVLERQEELEYEIKELKRRAAELEQLSHTLDHCQFLLSCASPLSATLEEDTHSSSSSNSNRRSSSRRVRPFTHFEDVTAAVSQLKSRLEGALNPPRTTISQTLPNKPMSRDDFLRYSRRITLDPNSAHKHLILSEENKKATLTDDAQTYPDHPDRFTEYSQVLSRERLTGRCYWEVDWTGLGVRVSVTYKNISRSGKDSLFSNSDKSWTLDWSGKLGSFYQNKKRMTVPGPAPSRVGVYLDHGAGILAFYRVAKVMTLLYRIQTSFTDPLHAGIYVWSSAELVKLK